MKWGKKHKDNKKYRSSQKPVDITKLKNKEVQRKYKEQIDTRCERNTQTEFFSIEDEWETMEKVIHESTMKVLTTKISKKKETWWDEECTTATEVRNKIRMKALTTQTEEDREAYRIERAKTKKIYRQKKRTKNKEKVKSIEEHYKRKEIRNFYREIKQGRQMNTQSLYIKDKEHNLLGEDSKVRERWNEYFCEMLNENAEDMSITVELKNKTEVAIPTMAELDEVIEKLKNNKSPGENNITAEHLKYAGEQLRQKLYRIVVEIWKKEKMPKDWEKASIIPIFKNGDRAECNNYRGISLIDVAYKVLATLIKIRLEPYVEAQIGEYQAGFRKGRGTTDQIFLMKEILTTSYEYKIPTEILFIDFKKAYDSVRRNAIIDIMEECNIPSKLIKLVMMTLQRTRCNVRIKGAVSEEFTVKSGVRQGDPLSTLLFNLVLEKVVRDAELNREGHILYKSHQLIGYADDIALIARNNKELKRIVQRLTEAAIKVGLQINETKSKWMRIETTVSEPALEVISKIGKMKFEAVEEYVYLGALVSKKCDETREINARLSKANRCAGAMNYLLRAKELSRTSKIRIYKTIIRPTALYSCETWILNKTTIDNLLRWERKILRRIMGGKRTEQGFFRRTNNEIYALYNQPKIDTVVRSRRLQWLGHMERMTDRRTVKAIAWRIPDSRRRRGRPRRRWRQAVQEDLEEKNVLNWRSRAKDRKTWKMVTKLWA